jgi:aspartyl protease family protein
MTNPEGPWSRLPAKPPSAPSRAPGGRLNLGLWLIFVVVMCALVYGLSQLFPGRLSSDADKADALRGVLLVSVVSAGVFAARLRFKQAMKYILIWMAVIAVMLLGYSFRADIAPAAARVWSQLVPSYPVVAARGEMMISQDSDGGYYVVGQVNGQAVRFLVDTGSSDIVLSPADARRLGVDVAALPFTDRHETANGVGLGAPYKASLTIGPVQLADAPMSINKAPMSASLLGMTFFNRLQSFRFEGKRLYLKPWS